MTTGLISRDAVVFALAQLEQDVPEETPAHVCYRLGVEDAIKAVEAIPPAKVGQET